MGMSISVKSDVKQLMRQLDSVQRRQIPFAVASALTLTAKEAQKEIQADIPNRFRVTKKWWLQQQPTGIKVQPATKQRWWATVFTNAYFAPLQEAGGTKTPYRGSSIVAPSSNVRAATQRRSGGAKEARNKPGVFFGKTRTGKTAMYRRKSKRQVELLYVFMRTARVKKRFGFKQQAVATVRRVFSRILKQRLDQAIATAR
jgi:hypothetical protein